LNIRIIIATVDFTEAGVDAALADIIDKEEDRAKIGACITIDVDLSES